MTFDGSRYFVRSLSVAQSGVKRVDAVGADAEVEAGGQVHVVVVFQMLVLVLVLDVGELALTLLQASEAAGLGQAF